MVGFLARLLKGSLLSRFTSKKVVFHIATINKGDLAVTREFVEAGKVNPVIDRRYSLNEAPDAIWHLEEGHARGKIVFSL